MSPIKVVGTPEYVVDVGNALNEICPGVEVGSDGAVTVDKIQCPGYCSHVAGCNLLLAFYGPTVTETVTIEDADSPWYFPGSNVIEWPRVGTTPDAGCAEDETAIKYLSPLPCLVHELVHAFHDVVTETHQSDLAPSADGEEACAVCGENQVRPELGFDPRLSYAGICVKCGPDVEWDLKGGQCELIPTDLQLPCDCDDTSPPKTLADLFLKPFGKVIAWLEWIIHRLPDLKPPQPRPDPPREGDEAMRERRSREDRDYPFSRLEEDRKRWTERVVLDGAFEEADVALKLEVLGHAGGYRIALILLNEADDRYSASLITNLEPYQDENGARLGPQRDLVQYDLTGVSGQAVVSLVQDILNEPQVDPEKGPAGELSVVKVRLDDAVREVVLRGWSFPADPRAQHRVPNDPGTLRLWRTVRRVRGVVAQLVRDTADTKAGWRRTKMIKRSGIVPERRADRKAPS